MPWGLGEPTASRQKQTGGLRKTAPRPNTHKRWALGDPTASPDGAPQTEARNIVSVAQRCAVFSSSFAPEAGSKDSCSPRLRMRPFFSTGSPEGAEADENVSVAKQCALFSSSFAPEAGTQDSPSLRLRMRPFFSTGSPEGAEAHENVSVAQQCAVFPSSVALEAGTQDSPSPCTRMVPLFPVLSREGDEVPDNVSVPQQCAVFPSTIAPEAEAESLAFPSSVALPTSTRFDQACPCLPGNAHKAHAHSGPAVLLPPEEQQSVHNSKTAVFPIVFVEPTGRCAFPSFTCVLNSISPSWQQECLTPEAFAAGRKGLSNVQLQQQLLQQQLQPPPQQQQQQQQQQLRDSEVHVDVTAWETDCSAGSEFAVSSEACLVHHLSASLYGIGQEMETRLERQERQESDEECGWFGDTGDPESVRQVHPHAISQQQQQQQQQQRRRRRRRQHEQQQQQQQQQWQKEQKRPASLLWHGSPSSHPRGAVPHEAHEAGCATWQPEAAIQGLQHAAVFTCSFGPEAGTGGELTFESTRKSIPVQLWSRGGYWWHRPPLYEHTHPVSLPRMPGSHGKEALLPPEAHAQLQEQEKEQEQSDRRAVCTASFSGKTCVLNSPSMGLRCSWHEKQEKEKQERQEKQEMRERRVQGLVATGGGLPGLHDGQWQSAARPGNRTVSGNPMEGSVDEEDLEELQDTASS
ncbi:unnamed protein product [Closterium sp. Naga37s-1]|nr:unnamed protein product [Closterium sp. Naga37s-1]